ncbi:MAG: hypothetical protein WD995_07830 [Gemmatimonadota bacterium]
MNNRADGDDSSTDRAARPRRPDHASRRLLWTAFAVSAVVHAVAIAVYPFLFDRLRPEAVEYPFATFSSEPQGVAVIRLVEIDEEDPLETPPEPEEVAVPATPGVAFDVPSFEPGIEVEFAPVPPTAAERLRPNLVDARIWAPLERVLGELTPARREELLASGRLQEWYDSVRVAEDAERALTDWTFTDDSGKRWGVSDGRVYLGDFSLPLPFDFGVAPGNRDEVNERLYQWEEIMRQGRQMEIRDSWRERSEAIRARRDRARAAGDSVPGPDQD